MTSGAPRKMHMGLTRIVPENGVFKGVIFGSNTLEQRMKTFTMGNHAPQSTRPGIARQTQTLVRDAIRLCHYSIRTEQAHIDWIAPLRTNRAAIDYGPRARAMLRRAEIN